MKFLATICGSRIAESAIIVIEGERRGWLNGERVPVHRVLYRVGDEAHAADVYAWNVEEFLE